MRYLTVSEVLELNRRVVAESGGTLGILNLEIQASADEQEDLILRVAAGEIGREDFAAWLMAHVQERPQL